MKGFKPATRERWRRDGWAYVPEYDYATRPETLLLTTTSNRHAHTHSTRCNDGVAAVCCG